MDCYNDDHIRHYNYYDEASFLSNLEPFVAMIMELILLYKPITGAEIFRISIDSGRSSAKNQVPGTFQFLDGAWHFFLYEIVI